MAEVEVEAPATIPPPEPRDVLYCGVCSLPPELIVVLGQQYCEYGGTVKKCQEWLEKADPEMHHKLYSDEAIAASLSTLSVDAQKRAQKDSAKKEAKAAAAEAKAAATLEASMVYVKRIERNKRKYVTAVSGLEVFGFDLKKVSKDFGKKFATGASVTKMASGGEEIVVQGDLSDEIFDFLTETAGYKDKIPEDNVECIEDKKKKAAA